VANKLPISPMIPFPTGDQNNLVSWAQLLIKMLRTQFSLISNRTNAMLAADGTEAAIAPVLLASYTVATVPAAASFTGGIIYVSNGTLNKRLAVSDGTNWRWPDGNIVS
jgi:hypothetical protein